MSAGKEGPRLVSVGKMREATARGTDALRRLAGLIDADEPDARGVLEALEAETARGDDVNPDDPDARILDAGTLAGLRARLDGTIWTVGDLLNRFGDVHAVDPNSSEASRIRRAQWDAPRTLWTADGWGRPSRTIARPAAVAKPVVRSGTPATPTGGSATMPSSPVRETTWWWCSVGSFRSRPMGRSIP